MILTTENTFRSLTMTYSINGKIQTFGQTTPSREMPSDQHLNMFTINFFLKRLSYPLMEQSSGPRGAP